MYEDDDGIIQPLELGQNLWIKLEIVHVQWSHDSSAHIILFALVRFVSLSAIPNIAP